MPKILVEKIATLTGHRDCLYAMTGGENPDIYFTSGADGMVARWDLQKPNEGELLANVQNSVYALCYLPDHHQLIVGQNNEGLHFIDLHEKKEIRSVKITDVPIFSIRYWEGKIFVGTGNGELIIVDFEKLFVIKRLQWSNQAIRALDISPNFQHIAMGYSDHKIRIADLSNFNLLHELAGHENSVFSLRYAPESNLLFSGSRDAQLKTWDAANDYQPANSLAAHMYTVNDISFREDGLLFATCSKDKSIKIWRTDEMRLLKVIDKARYAGHGTSVNKVLWKGNENIIVSCSDDRTASVWELGFEK